MLLAVPSFDGLSPAFSPIVLSVPVAVPASCHIRYLRLAVPKQQQCFHYLLSRLTTSLAPNPRAYYFPNRSRGVGDIVRFEFILGSPPDGVNDDAMYEVIEEVMEFGDIVMIDH